MRKVYKLALVLVLSFSITIDASSQWVSIPDTNFGTWLNTHGYSGCMSGNNQLGWQMDTTCPAVTSAISISCGSNNISDLTGITYFDNLDSLTCGANLMSTLPTLPVGLLWLNCGGSLYYRPSGITIRPHRFALCETY